MVDPQKGMRSRYEESYRGRLRSLAALSAVHGSRRGPALIGSAFPSCSVRQISDLLELAQQTVMILRQISNDARIGEKT